LGSRLWNLKQRPALLKFFFPNTGGRQDAVIPLVTDIMNLGLDVLLTWGPPLSLAAKRATIQIPLVFLITFDPIDIGLVSNLAHPGGNVTGVTSLSSLEIFAKRLQLLRELIPSLTHVAVLLSTEQTRSDQAKEVLATAAKTLGVELHDFEIQAPSDLKFAMHSAKDQGAQAVYVWPSGFTFSFARQISEDANANHLPTIHSFREGALATYLGFKVGETSDVGARMSETFYEASAYRVRHLQENDGLAGSCVYDRLKRWVGLRNDQIRPRCDRFFCVSAHPLNVPSREAVIKLNIPVYGPSEHLQSCVQCLGTGARFSIIRYAHQHENPPHALRLLRKHSQRPRSRCAPEERDEVAAVHSMTSSARASNCAGTSMPSAFAVFKLMSRLNFVGSTTGKSPFRTRPI